MTSPQTQRLITEFFCEVPIQNIPNDILDKVIKNIRFTKLDPAEIAVPLYRMELLDKDTMVQLQSQLTMPGTRRNQLLFTLLPRCGYQQRTLAKFYFALITSGTTVGVHRELASQVRLCALKLCRNVLPGPIITPGAGTLQMNKEVVSRMAEKLMDVVIPIEVAQDFCSYLGQEDPSDGASLGAIVQQWVESTDNLCSPESIIDALVCTKGLGRYASKLAYPWNPPEVAASLTGLGHNLLTVAEFMGYTAQELPMQQGPERRWILPVPRFLNMWKIPDCGEKTVQTLDTLKRMTGFITEDFEDNFIPEMSTQVSSSSLSSRLGERYQSYSSVSEEEKSEDRIMSFQVDLRFKGYSPQRSNESASVRPVTISPAVLTLKGQDVEHPECTGRTVEDELVDTPRKKPADSSMLEKTKQSNTFCEEACEEVKGKQPPSSRTQMQLRRVEHDQLFHYCRNPNPVAVDQAKKILAERGDYPNIQTVTDGLSLLHIAVASGSVQMVKLLIQSGADVEVISDDHMTPLMMACVKKRKQMVELLLQSNADPNVKNCNGEACLHFKETLECTEVVHCLLQHVANVDIPRDGNSLTPLARCCQLGYAGSAQVLLGYNANPDGSDASMETPLTLATKIESTDCMEALISSGCSINAKNTDGTTALIQACELKKQRAAMCLLEHNADVNIQDMDGGTALWYAVNGRMEYLMQLILIQGQGDSVNIPRQPDRTKGEITPLSLAAAGGELAMITVMIDHGANVNYTSASGLTALGWAVKEHRVPVVALLLKHNDTRKDIHALSRAIELAATLKYRQCGDLLINALGGEEKAMSKAREAHLKGTARAIRDLCGRGEKGYENAPDHSAANVYGECSDFPQAAFDDPNVGWNILLQFTQVAISSYLNGRSQEFLIREACDSPYGHIRDFFLKYFYEDQYLYSKDLLTDFLTGCPRPCRFLFESRNFSGEAFAKAQRDIGEPELVDKVGIALIQIAESADAVTCIPQDASCSSEGLLEIMFGNNFLQEVKAQGLIGVSTHAAQPLAMGAPYPSYHTDRVTVGHEKLQKNLKTTQDFEQKDLTDGTRQALVPKTKTFTTAMLSQSKAVFAQNYEFTGGEEDHSVSLCASAVHPFSKVSPEKLPDVGGVVLYRHETVEACSKVGRPSTDLDLLPQESKSPDGKQQFQMANTSTPVVEGRLPTVSENSLDEVSATHHYKPGEAPELEVQLSAAHELATSKGGVDEGGGLFPTATTAISNNNGGFEEYVTSESPQNQLNMDDDVEDADEQRLSEQREVNNENYLWRTPPETVASQQMDGTEPLLLEKDMKSSVVEQQVVHLEPSQPVVLVNLKPDEVKSMAFGSLEDEMKRVNSAPSSDSLYHGSSSQLSQQKQHKDSGLSSSPMKQQRQRYPTVSHEQEGNEEEALGGLKVIRKQEELDLTSTFAATAAQDFPRSPAKESKMAVTMDEKFIQALETNTDAMKDLISQMKEDSHRAHERHEEEKKMYQTLLEELIKQRRS